MTELQITKHHTQFPACLHNAVPPLAKLREDHRLIVPLDWDTHSALHKELPLVPPLSFHLAQRAFNNLQGYLFTPDYVRNLDNYQRSIEDAAKHPRATRIERGLADLTLHALDIQKPFVRQGALHG